MAKPTDIFATPRGTLTGFVALTVPSQKYDTYSANLLVEGDAGEKLKAYVDKLVNYAKKHHGNSDGHTPYTVTDAGVVFTIKNKASFVYNGETIDTKPTLWDASNKKIEDLIKIGEGTVCKIQIAPYIWTTGSKAGVTLQPKHVQIIDLVEYSPDGGGNSSPFDKIDGAYKANKDNMFDAETDKDDFEESKPTKEAPADDGGFDEDIPF